VLAGVTFTGTVVRSHGTGHWRIGDPQGLPLLLPLLEDRGQRPPSAAFAMGLLRDPNAVAPLIGCWA
jgi:hypothetical protein